LFSTVNIHEDYFALLALVKLVSRLTAFDKVFSYCWLTNKNVFNAEVQSTSRPPTIDQEFEEYFSMLML